LRKKYLIRAWAIWVLAAMFYLYELALRISPSIMVNDLMRDLDITAQYIGLLGFAYYISYTPIQLPVGILFDRFGARMLLTLAALTCSVGAFIFGFSTHISPVLLARFIIGLGSAFAWVGVTYLISHWFEEKRMGMLIGLASSLGVMGGVFGAGPLALLVNMYNWQSIVISFGVIGLVLTLLMWFIIRNDPKEMRTTIPKTRPNLKKVIQGLKIIVSIPQSWIVALYSTMIYSCTTIFAELWGVSFIRLDHGLDSVKAAFATSMIYVGWMVGGPIVGFISDTMGKRKPLLIIGAIGALITISSALYIPMRGQILWLYTTLFFFGFFSNAQLLSFSLAIENNPPQTKGSALALNNFVTMLGGMILNPFVGWMLDYFWSGKVVKGLPIYTSFDFRLALTVLPILCVIGLVLSFFVKETFCKMVYTKKKHKFEFHSD